MDEKLAPTWMKEELPGQRQREKGSLEYE